MNMENRLNESISELKGQISDYNMRMTSLRKQNDNLKSKLQKSNANENILKEQFENLEEQKYKIDRLLMQNIEQLRESKNNLLKY